MVYDEHKRKLMSMDQVTNKIVYEGAITKTNSLIGIISVVKSKIYLDSLRDVKYQ